MDSQTIAHIRDRVERCRRLARQTTDDRARIALLELADEGEADLRKLEAEMAQAPQPEPDPNPPQSNG